VAVFDQHWLDFVLFLDLLQGRLAQGRLRQLLVIEPDMAVQSDAQFLARSEAVALQEFLSPEGFSPVPRSLRGSVSETQLTRDAAPATLRLHWVDYCLFCVCRQARQTPARRVEKG
jgi:hypothetical protein